MGTWKIKILREKQTVESQLKKCQSGVRTLSATSLKATHELFW